MHIKKRFIAVVAVTLLLSFSFGGLALAEEKSLLRLPAKALEEEQATITRDAKTKTVRFFRAESGQAIAQPKALPKGATPEKAARSFLSVHGNMFGIKTQDRELSVLKTKKASRGRSVVRFQQRYQGIPVYGAELNVQMDANKNILSVNGSASPDVNLSTRPAFSKKDAMKAAIASVAKSNKSHYRDLKASTPELWIYNPSLVYPSGENTNILAWRSEVEAKDERTPIKEMVLVSAQDGTILLQLPRIFTARSRRVYDANNNSSLPGTLARSEGQAATGDELVDRAYEYMGDTYDFYATYHGRDGINNAGMIMKTSVYYKYDSCNAFWNGSQMAFDYRCDLVTDDIMGHEITHGVTSYESNLDYSYQSGAVNEAFSDIWGEFIDLTNGRGNDSASVRWQLGEDMQNVPSGWSIPLRDMKDPGAHSQPDRMTSPNYYCATGSPTSSNDYGGVHYNNGIGNKLAYLLTDGDTFNGYTVTGLGISKTAKLFYEAQTNILTTSSDYSDLGNALIQACSTLGYSSSECQEVEDAVNATELFTPPCGETDLVCTDAVTISSGVAYNGTTSGADSNVDAYDIVNWNESGPEKVHTITTTSTGTITATLSNMSADLDVFILTECSTVAYGDNTASYSNAPAGTYYIVVDGPAGATD